MILFKKCKELQSRIEILRNNQGNVDEVKALQERLNEILPIQENLAEVMAKAKLLSENEISMDSMSDRVAIAATSLNKVKTRFEERSISENLTKGREWTKVISDVEVVETEIRSKTIEAWRNFLKTIFTGQTPNEIENNLAKTEKNNKLLVEYRDLYQEFRNNSEQFPRNVESIKNIISESKKLLQLQKKFDFDVPDSVKIFLDSVVSGRATLHLLTEEVTEWLKKNRSFDNYRIVSR
jgi:hypothetical protein